MINKRRAIVIALTVFAVLLSGNPAQAAPSTLTAVASPSEIPGDNYLYGADSSSASNVWAVGAVYPPNSGGFRAVALRFDGTAWSSVPRTGLPDNMGLRGVEAVSATDVWAVGDQRAGISGSASLAAHWNGSAWTRESTPNGNPNSMNNLYGVAVAGGTVWAVGAFVDPNSSVNRRKLILQRTSSGWRVSPAPTVAAHERLLAVDATGSADVWAVGDASSNFQSAPQTPLALHWNGSSWASIAPPAPAGTALAGVDARTSSDVWAVGSTPTSPYGDKQPYVAHFDGNSWRRVPTPAIAGELTDVVALSPTAVVAVGRSNYATLVLRWNGSSWTQEATPTFSNPFLTAAAPAGPNTAWAIGYRFELNAYANRTLTLRES